MTFMKMQRAVLGIFAVFFTVNMFAQVQNDSVAADSSKILPPADSVYSIPLDANVVDEVVWVVGDEAILKSDIEAMRIRSQEEGVRWEGNPDCVIPEQIAIQKLFLNQAIVDSVEVTDAEIAQDAENQLNSWIQLAGSREKLEEYRKMPISQMREELRTELKNRKVFDMMKEKITGDVTVTPGEVRDYFKDLPQDSLPTVPAQVEVQIITRTPRIPAEEINRIKNELRDYTDRVNNGETSFATLARLYSEDPGSARQGGEMDYVGRGMLDPAFANVAFNLTSPNKVSKIVESEYGYHIIQLIDKRGDKIKCRHILRKPRVAQVDVDSMIARLDTLVNDINAGKVTFDEAASFVSDDKDTRKNKGIMFVTDPMTGRRTSKCAIQDLPSEVAKAISPMEVGTISAPFVMINANMKTVCAIVKLKSRTPRHKATMKEDYPVLQNVVLAQRKQEVLKKWIQDKIKTTYVRINPKYRDCDFEYSGWVK